MLALLSALVVTATAAPPKADAVAFRFGWPENVEVKDIYRLTFTYADAAAR